MPGLSDIHLFNKYDLFIGENPISISNQLNTQLKIPESCFTPISCSSERQCGSIPIKMNKIQWSRICGDTTFSKWMEQQKKITVKELLKKINKYIEKKCKEYCKFNRIPTKVWQSFATYEYFNNNKWEVRYKGELICGVRIIYELKHEDFSEKTSISLELY